MLDKFSEIMADRHRSARRWKQETGGKVIGCFCTFVPEELIHAAGALPVRLMGEYEGVTEADGYLQSNVCPYARSCFDIALKGQYDYLDGVVISHTCDIMTKMYDFWRDHMKLPYIHFLSVPHTSRPESAKFFSQELKRFQASLEEFTGTPITEERLRSSIKLHNQYRGGMRKLYDRRAEIPVQVKGAEAMEAVLAGLVMPKEDHLQLLSQALADKPSSDSQDVPRVLISGSTLDKTDLFRMVEESGGMVVTDDLCTGTRFFWRDVKEEGDPLGALVDRYFYNIPCARMHPSEGSIDHLLEMIDKFQVDGVILNVLSYCDNYLYDYPMVRDRLKAEGVPLLFVENDYSTGGLEGLRPRIETFVEMIGGRI